MKNQEADQKDADMRDILLAGTESQYVPDPFYIVWDLETSGFTAPRDKILEIGCRIVSMKGAEDRYWVLNNNIEIPEKIVEITGITNEIIALEGRDPVECLKEFLPLFKSCELNITHNGIRFDIPFLAEYATSMLGWDINQKDSVYGLLRRTAFDTAVHFKAKKLGMQQMRDEHFANFADRIMQIRAHGVKYSLPLCVEEMGIRIDGDFHRAMADVRYTHALAQNIELHFENLLKNHIDLCHSSHLHQ